MAPPVLHTDICLDVDNDVTKGMTRSMSSSQLPSSSVTRPQLAPKASRMANVRSKPDPRLVKKRQTTKRQAKDHQATKGQTKEGQAKRIN